MTPEQEREAEKSSEAWIAKESCFQVGALSWIPREAYIAGYAAALAANQGEAERKEATA